MKAAVFAFSQNGVGIGERLLEFLRSEGFETTGYTTEEYARESDLFLPAVPDFKTVVGGTFGEGKLLVFVGALGIAVRMTAPFLCDKVQDPAVVCMDETARFVIPVLSGHIGGANRFAERIAQWGGATAVVTTATDVHGVFAVDKWAAEQGLIIDNVNMVKRISKALLGGECVGWYTDFRRMGVLPEGVRQNGHESYAGRDQYGIVVSLNKQEKPFVYTLNLLPRIVHVGIGCRKGVPLADIEAAVLKVLEEHGMDIRSVCGVASIELKRREAGVLAFAERYEVPAVFYPAEDLAKVKGLFSSSEFVKSVASVDNVCERAAVMSSGGGRLLVRKTAGNGVTVAAAVADWCVCFEEAAVGKGME